jgi:hypothetical protein
MHAISKPILRLPKGRRPPPARKIPRHIAVDAARAIGPHADLKGEELTAKEKECHSWFLNVMSAFTRLHEAAERQGAKHFVWERRFQIKKSFWRGDRRDDVLCTLIEEKAAFGAAS